MHCKYRYSFLQQTTLAYASGQDIVLHTEAGRYVQSISHPDVAEPITRLVAGPGGCMAAVSGQSAFVFRPCEQNSCTHPGQTSSSSNTQWQYVSRLDVSNTEKRCRISDCAWIDSTSLVLGTGAEFSLWSFFEDAWKLRWRQKTAGQIDKIASVASTGMFATMTLGSRFVKVWQFSNASHYVPFRYIVHSTPVVNIFWQPQHIQGRQQCFALYTVTSDHQLCLWHSVSRSSKDPCEQGLLSPENIAFYLAASIDIAQDDLRNGLDPDKQRKPVSVGLWNQRNGAQNPSNVVVSGLGSGNNDSINGGSSGNKAPETLQSDTRSSHNQDNMSIADGARSTLADNEETSAVGDNTSNQIEHLRSAASISDRASGFRDPGFGSSYPYAVFNDGSVVVWEVKQGTSAFSIANVRVLFNTSANKTAATPYASDRFNGLFARSCMWNTSDVFDGNESSLVLQLAIADSVGHVLLLNTPALSRNGLSSGSSETCQLEVSGLWDGHKEPIFHISVDPYGQRVATHSVEGELLVWDQIDIAGGKKQSISRRMALDGSSIRTIAWAPADSEFIAATSKHIYRLVYNEETAEWAPCDMVLSQLRPYDRIFTYPADPIDRFGSSQKTQSYYISTVDKEAMSVQTWQAAGHHGKVVFVGSSILSSPARFDRVSRVMPVAHPFFSRDNIMATFDSSSGKLLIWGIRTDTRFVWFCSKEHRLPCMNVDMIRYNSIDKAAIVSSEPDGSQVVTIWVFSSASRASHYLPAGTIRPRSKSDRVREIRWHLTEFAQTYLGIQWDKHIDIYCQERNLDDAWTCVFSIDARDYGADKTIGSFSFTAAGEPTFSIDRKLVTYTQQIPDGRTLAEAAYEEHGQLPFIHPYVLTELMSWGRAGIASKLLAQLYDYLREKEIDHARKVCLPMVSLQELVTFENSDENSQTLFSGAGAGAGSQRNARTKYMALFGDMDNTSTDNELTMDVNAPDFEKFTQEKAEYLIEKLTEIKIDGISNIDQARLMSIVSTISASLTNNQPIDSMGIRYLVKLQLLELENKRTRSSAELPYRELNWAMHSSSQAILLQLCLQRQQENLGSATGLTWEAARRMGIFLWLSDTSALLSEVEKMARNMFVSDGRDPSKCGIFYLALRKQRLLHGLWRTAHSHAEHSKMVAFLAHDFSEARWKTAAAKNAYVLLSRQRYLDAATFFMLSGKLIDAATICITQLKDIQLAITICRCYEGDNGPVLKEIIWKHILPDAFRRQDRWLASLAFGLVGKYDLVLQSLTDDLTRLAQQIGVEANGSGFSTMDVLDTELLILYRSMINHSPFYRAPLVTQAELIAQTITIFECLGAPVMSLVVLEWWRRELFEITKKASALSKTPHKPGPGTSVASTASSADPLSSGALDSSSVGLFAGFSGVSGARKPAPDPAADPLASGLLSMDSFGSMFSGKPKRPAAANSTPTGLAQANGYGRSSHSSNARTAESLESNADESALVVEIEDTPVQYACRAALALQIIEFKARSMLRATTIYANKALFAASSSRASAARVSIRISAKRFATTNSTPGASPAASTASTTPAASATAEASAKAGVRDSKAAFTTQPKPAPKKKKTHKIRNTLLLTLLAGSGFVAAAAYAQEDLEFGQQFEHYVPGAKSFMRLVRYHDDSLVMAVSDVGFHAYSDLVYTSRFIYGQFYNLLNMLQHNNWKGAPDSEDGSAVPSHKRSPVSPSKPAADTKKPAVAAGPMEAALVSNIQVAVEIPTLETDNAVVAKLSRNLSTVVEALNKKGLSPENVQQVKALSDSLVALDKHLSGLKDEEKKVVETALAEEQKKFENTLSEFQKTSRAALLAREAELIDAKDTQLRVAAAAAEERVASELAAQRDLLERRFNRFVRARVDEERGGRLAHLDRVEAQLRQLAQLAQESGDMIRQSRAVSKLGIAISALKSAAVGAQVQTPFASELSALASAATTDFPATRAAFASIPRDIAELGVPSQTELESRFDSVRREIRSVALVPENGNLGSQVLSATLSKVMFEKEGLVEGDDVEAVLSRAGFYLKQHNLDLATRELNQLKGWPKKLAEDWIASARCRLEVEQAISVAESEALLAKLTLV
ncbi:regulator of (H+)-ATPase in vacuolar membrane [Coemansia sp. RSA 485]|nr:regulator of (H+)-ATPase in vacuolar membrane [Coemansia sp. RSA 485]